MELQAYLLAELSKLAERPSMAEIVSRAQARAKGDRVFDARASAWLMVLIEDRLIIGRGTGLVSD